MTDDTPTTDPVADAGDGAELSPAYDCQSCGRGIFMDVLCRDDIWRRITPTEGLGGLLCAACIADRIAALGLGRDWAAALIVPANAPKIEHAAFLTNLVAERDAQTKRVAVLREALAPFALALSVARNRLGDPPQDVNDLHAITLRFIRPRHFKDAEAALKETSHD